MCMIKQIISLAKWSIVQLRNLPKLSQVKDEKTEILRDQFPIHHWLKMIPEILTLALLTFSEHRQEESLQEENHW